MNAPVACTIVANNYLAYARVLTGSFLERHPDGKMFVLLVDRPDPSICYGEEQFTAVFAEDLGVPGFLHVAFRYSIIELSTSIKAFFLLYLHRTTGCEHLCYFDPDILVTGDLGAIYQRLGDSDAVLTPHISAPVEDGLVPGERDFLLSGIYNLGFLGISFNERTVEFLEWWHRRLYRECLHAVDRGLFVDQRWMDFAPAFLDRISICRDQGCNVSYWNLIHRTLSRTDDGWQVGAAPMRFFHFSGYSLDRPEAISRYQNRFVLSDRPDLLMLFADYARRLRAAGHPKLVVLPCAYDRFADGTPIPDVAREALRLTDPLAQRWPDPFSSQRSDSFVAWLEQADDPAAPVALPRLALFLWERRPDLQQAFPHPEKADRMAFAQWFAQRDETEKIGLRFTRRVVASLRQAGVSVRTPRGMTVADRMAAGVSAGDDLAGALPQDELEWLSNDALLETDRRPRMPRLAMMLHRNRTDLQGTFADPLGADRARFALWFATHGRAEYSLPGAVVAPVLSTLPLRDQMRARLWWQRQKVRRRPDGRRRQAAPAEPAVPVAEVTRQPGPPQIAGLNVVGWATAPTGVGEACRSSLRALQEVGLRHALWNLGASAADNPRAGEVGGVGGQGLPYEISLFHVNADMMEVVSRQLPRALVTGRYQIGFWFWELAHFPLSFADAFSRVSEVWAPTRFCQQAFSPLAPVEVRWVPPAVIPPVAAPIDRRELGIDPGEFLFFFAFDALSIPDRKNPEGLVTAFAQAVRKCHRPLHLLLKINHPEAAPELVESFQEVAADLPITVISRGMSRGEMDSLTAACDAYVSLHRSEGLGLPLIEAMYLGKPVIATGYGGCTDFLDDSTGWVVRHTLTVLDKSRGPYPAGSVWAEPDVESAASHMIEVASNPEAAAVRAEAGRRRVTEMYTPAVAGARFRDEMERILDKRGRCTD